MRNDSDNIFQIIDPWSCCDLATVPIEHLREKEELFFVGFMPQATTAIVLGHHVTKEEEWTWYGAESGSEHCAADDHLLEVCRTIEAKLVQEGNEVKLVDYPRQSGLQFRYVAQAAGLGQIGKNAFLFHPEWEPWVHLRVMGTTAELDLHSKLSGDQLCDECGFCISKCPAQAISDNSFEGLQWKIGTHPIFIDKR